MIFIGIDPGYKGGIAILDDKKPDNTLHCLPIPVKEYPTAPKKLIDIAFLISCMASSTSYSSVAEVHVFLESIHAFPGQGVCSMFNFGMGFGQLMGMCQAMSWQMDLISPQRWKAWLKEKYNKTPLELIEKIYPEAVVKIGKSQIPHDGIVEAACILEYGMQNLRRI